MLLNIHIKNYALIDELNIEFASGFNVFTGETGAGKSIVIESLGLALGERPGMQAVKNGPNRCVVTAEFDVSGVKEISACLENLSIEKSPDENLILRREIDMQGKSRAFVNDMPVSVAVLQALGEQLVDMHGQHEHQSLIKPASQQALLDRFGGSEELKRNVSSKYSSWKKLLMQYESNSLSEQEKQRLIDLYSFQVNEIDNAKLFPGVEEELEAQLPQMKNAEKLRELASEAHSLLYSGETTVLSMLAKAKKLTENISLLGNAIKDTSENISNAYFQLEEAATEIQSFIDGLSSDPEKLNEMLERQDLISKLKKKYGTTVQEIIAYRDKTAAELEVLNKSGENKKELEKVLEKEKQKLFELCKELSSHRKKAALKLAQQVQKELSELGMKKVVFDIKLETESEPSQDGWDKIDFVFSPNAGRDMKPIKNIASGGEMSRVMLAVKTVLAKSDSVPVLVFDEIDAGVGGPTAQVVGTKLKHLSKNHQVLCITHLPQIAAFYDRHFLVKKELKNERAVTLVSTLSENGSLEEIARMLSGREITATARKHARELITQSE